MMKKIKSIYISDEFNPTIVLVANDGSGAVGRSINSCSGAHWEKIQVNYTRFYWEAKNKEQIKELTK